MAHRGLFFQLLTPFLIVILAAVLLATWADLRAMKRFHLEEVSLQLQVMARMIEREMSPPLSEGNSVRVDALCKELASPTQSRVTIILPSGKVLGDSDEDPANMDNHADRPEVREAIAGRVGQAQRYSHTLKRDWVYVAVPVLDAGNVVGVIRTSASLESVDNALWQVFVRSIISSLAVAVLAILVSYILAHRITRPIKQIEAGAKRYAHGDFQVRLPEPQTAELSSLASTMNSMAADLRSRIQAMDRQRSERDAVLSSMAEGVLAVDNAERVIRLNHAAARILGTNPETASGRSIEEVVRNPKFQECVARILSAQEPFEEEIMLVGPEEKLLRVSATALRGEQGDNMGALLVFNDITQLRRLERARSDFVANISHEIRTPVTSIKGYAETLLGEETTDPETASRFLEIIARQADRLCSIVDDILSLASLERAQAAGDVAFERTLLRNILDAAASVCAPKASQKNLRIQIECPEELEIDANPALIEQAVINLLDNAIKYSNPDADIRVEAEQNPEQTIIRVRDSGIGIAAEHLPRIFERFYRVDRARSRKLGGTGLGLAIVKHILTLHHGRIFVESVLGRGSTFTIQLPARHIPIS